jgi:hypothetical protein
MLLVDDWTTLYDALCELPVRIGLQAMERNPLNLKLAECVRMIIGSLFLRFTSFTRKGLRMSHDNIHMSSHHQEWAEDLLILIDEGGSISYTPPFSHRGSTEINKRVFIVREFEEACISIMT